MRTQPPRRSASVSNVGRQSTYSTIGMAIQGVARLGAIVVVGREFGASFLGQMSTLLAIGIFLSFAWPVPVAIRMSAAIAHSDGGSSAIFRAYRRQIVLGTAALTAACILISLVVAPGWLPFQSGLVFGTYSIYMFARLAQIAQGGAHRVMIWDGISAVSAAVIVVVAAVAHERMLVLPALAISYLVFAFACWPHLIRRDAEQPGHTADVRGIWHIASAQVATGGLLNIAMLAAHIFGAVLNVGLFAAAYALATPASLLGLSLHQVLVPFFSRELRLAHPARMIRRTTLAASVVILTAFATMGLLSGILVRLFFGVQFADAVPIMIWLLIGVCTYSLCLAPAAALVAATRSADFTRGAVVGFVVGVILMFALGPVLDVYSSVVGFGVGAAVSTAMITGYFLVLTARPRTNRDPSGRLE